MYDLNVASIIGKTIKGQTYYYLREVARVGGKPKVISQRYLGKAADIEAAGRYIAAILSGDPLTAILGETYATAESERLWDRFVSRYAGVVSGAYAKHGADALRIALTCI